MFKSIQQSQTYQIDTAISIKQIDNLETANFCPLVVKGTRHHGLNCPLCLRKLCPKCFHNVELFAPKEGENNLCPHCSYRSELKKTILCVLFNTIQLLIFLSLLPFVAFAMAIQKTEKVIQNIERKVQNILTILIVNLILSIPIYIGIFGYSMVLAPFRLVEAFKQAMEKRNFEILKKVISQQ